MVEDAVVDDGVDVVDDVCLLARAVRISNCARRSSVILYGLILCSDISHSESTIVLSTVPRTNAVGSTNTLRPCRTCFCLRVVSNIFLDRL